MNDYNHIREWLGHHLQQKNLSVEQLARKAGLSRAMIYFYIEDRNRPSSNSMARICKVLGVPLEEGMKQFTPRKPGPPFGRREPRAFAPAR